MKVLVLPDTHGNSSTLENAVKHANEVDKIIFLGDYCDSHDLENDWLQQKKVLTNILNFKAKQPKNKVVLLVGNHDLSYIPKYGASSNVSGHQYFQAAEIQEFFCKNFDNFQAAEIVDHWLFTHAGVTQDWLDNPLGKSRYQDEAKESSTFWQPEDINKHFRKKELFYFNHNSNDPYGDDSSEGCTWIRPPSLIRFGVEGYHQCVGHTVLEKGEAMEYWFLESRLTKAQDWYDSKHFYDYQYKEENVPRNLDCKYVFLDSPDNSCFAFIDTETDEVIIREN